MNNEKIIEKVNKYLNTRIFEMPVFYGLPSDQNFNINIKIRITGQKNMISVGDWKEFYTYEVTILPSSEFMNNIIPNLFNGETIMDIKSHGNKSSMIESISARSAVVLHNLLDNFSITQPVILTKLINKVNEPIR